jgi:uncharacterized delta-60 repeat protein
MTITTSICARRWRERLAAWAVVLAVSACGGGGGSGDGDVGDVGDVGATAPPPVTAPIGAAGGTVNGPSGAQVLIPAGALAAEATIAIEQTSAGAPALPTGVTPFGPMFAFTPHGTSFTTPVTITVPFDPALVPAGETPALYKTNASLTIWAEVPGATVNGNSMSGVVTGFSDVVVASLQRFPDLTKKTWDVRAVDINDEPTQPLSADTQVGGEVFAGFRVGLDMPITPAPRVDPRALVEVFSNDSGKTFWTFAEAPHLEIEFKPNLVTSSSVLTQTYTFKKNDAAATLQFLVTRSTLNLINQEGLGPGPSACPWLPENPTEKEVADDCTLFMLSASNHFTLEARQLLRPDAFYSVGGHAELDGVGLGFFSVTYPQPAESRDALWAQRDYSEEHDIAANGIFVFLKRAIPINVPLDSVLPGEIFNVVVSMRSDATNLVQGKSYAGAFLRDPLSTGGGTTMSFSGLEPLPPREDIPPEPQPQPCTTGPDPQAGTLQFSKADFRAPERPPGARVIVERIGGTKGDVSVLFETADGTALAGSDYKPVRTIVRFKDGLDGQRLLTVPLVLDKIAEPNETVNLKLTMFSGCAALGAQSTATLTILDDDRPISVKPTFALGGTVTGLSGSGLVLRTNLFDEARPTANGTFSFPKRVANGSAYTVSVATPPANPLQVCAVTNGSGTITGADVTNIRVDCVTPAANGALDPSFGSQGKLFGSGGSTALARQADGKLLTLGGLQLTRLNADGSIDASFGSGGTVTIVANGGALDAMRALALQPDGRIVVAGNTSLPTVPLGDDFVVFRFNADGSLDSSFGSGGKVVTDFNGKTDRAVAVMVQSDGRIVAAGNAVNATNTDQDFALVRYLPDGTLDAAFGARGKATLNITGVTDIANAAALQSDGKIVVVGRTFHDRFGSSAGEPDIGVGRFRADGTVDTSFGNQGVVRVDTSIAAVTAPDFNGGNWDDANDVAIAADGRIVIGGYTITAGVFRSVLVLLTSGGQLELVTPSPLADEFKGVALQTDGKVVAAGRSNGDFALVRFLASGTLDTSFGIGGQLRIDFFGGFDSANDVLVQPDGKIVAVGSASNGASRGSGLVRVLP